MSLIVSPIAVICVYLWLVFVFKKVVYGGADWSNDFLIPQQLVRWMDTADVHDRRSIVEMIKDHVL